MDIGIPRETRPGEHRVALAPWGVKSLVQQGHRVWVETGAGAAAGHPDADYESAGASIGFTRGEAYARGHLVAAVAAPEPGAFELLQPGQVVFAFWAFPTLRPEDVRALLARQISAVGLEAIEDDHGRAPVLTSMSEIAGGLAVTMGAGLLLNELGGKGILLGGAPGVPPADVVILGAGVLGRSAARAARGLGAQVTLLDRSLDALRAAARELDGGAATLLAGASNLEKVLGFADVVIGAVAVHGQRAPVLVTQRMLRFMKPRSLVIDLSIDMGGCFETSRPTSFPEPVYSVDGIRHFCVPNLPASAARSTTQALTNAVLPYLEAVAEGGLEAAVKSHRDLRRGVYVHAGACGRDSLARALDLPKVWLPGDDRARTS
jgi:alanine dehydrogenase